MASTGDQLRMPDGALYTFRNRSGATVHVRNWHRHSVRFEEFIERMCTMLRAAVG